MSSVAGFIYSANSPIQQFRLSLHLHPSAAAAIGRLDLDRLRTGTDHRLDELPIRVFIAAVEEFRDRLNAIGTFVVDAGKVQRAKRIVWRTDDEQTGEPAIEAIEHLREIGGLERSQMLAGAATKIGAAGAQFVGVAGRGCGAYENDLLCTRGSDFAKQPTE